VVGWLRRGLKADRPSPSGPPPDGLDDQDRPEALNAKIAEQVRFLNRHSGQLPAVAMVHARQLTDTLAAIVATSETRPLDIYAILTVRNSLHDYLPTTIARYLAVPEAQREAPDPSGLTPTASLHDQIDSMLSAALNVLEAAQRQDVDALLTQGAFLTTKFSGSDLDL
jgi:hypothetical protein